MAGLLTQNIPSAGMRSEVTIAMDLIFETEKNKKHLPRGKKELLKYLLLLSSVGLCVCHCHGCEIGQSDADDEVGKM